MEVVNPDLIHYHGRIKYYKKGVKFYAPVVALPGQYHPLLKHFRTVTEAIAYGEQTVKRYRRLLSKVPAEA
jgi:hypothetical protein